MAIRQYGAALPARAIGLGSVTGIVVGLLAIGFGGAAATTVGVILVVLSVVGLLLAVGTYLGR